MEICDVVAMPFSTNSFTRNRCLFISAVMLSVRGWAHIGDCIVRFLFFRRSLFLTSFFVRLFWDWWPNTSRWKTCTVHSANLCVLFIYIFVARALCILTSANLLLFKYFRQSSTIHEIHHFVMFMLRMLSIAGRQQLCRSHESSMYHVQS